MGFFATFWSWLNQQLSTYIGDNTARVAQALEPVAVTLAVLYVMVWGYLLLLGRIEEPFGTGIKRVACLAVVLGASLRLWLYNDIIVDTFYNAPAQLAAAVVGAPDPVGSVDAIWAQGGKVADLLWSRAAGFGLDIGDFMAGLVVWTLVGLLCVYTMFLISLSHVALAVLLALGPLFIVMFPFDATRRFFDAWLGQLANYALITILTIMAAALLLKIVVNYAAQTAQRGPGILTVDAINMVLVSVLVFLFMRQVMPIAAGLTSGTALNSFGTVSRVVTLGARKGASLAALGVRVVAVALTG